MKDVINELKRRNINLRLKNEEDLEVLFPGERLSDEDIREIRDKKPALVSYLKSISSRNAFAAIKRAPKQDDYPVSSSQKRIWILCQFEGGSEAYSISSIYTIRESMDPDAFRRAFDAVIARHEILRTIFIVNKDNEIRQVVGSPAATKPDFEYSSFPEGTDKGALAKEKVRKDISAPFQLDRGPLIRARLIRTGEKEYLAAFNIHHILADGWSMSILFREILELYRQFAGELNIGLSPLTNQYKDYAVWEEQQLKSGQYEEARLYWMDQLSGELPVIHLPVDHPRPATKTFNGRRATLKIDHDLTQRLRQLAGSKGGTLYMALMSAVNAWLYLYTEQNDIIIGAPVSGRVHVDIETQIGCYINTLAFRNRFEGECSFSELFSLVKATTLKAYDYQYYPFEQVVQDIALQRDPSRSPLFDIMVVLQNTEMPANREDQEEKTLDIKSDETETSTSRFDLGFEFREEQGGLNLTLEYNSDLFERTTMDSMLRIFRQCMTVMLATPDLPLNQLDYLGKEEKDKLLEWGGLFSDLQPDFQRRFISAVEWLDQQALQSPGQEAVRGQENSLTYRDLQTGSDQLARQLIRLGIRPGDRILLFMEKGPASLLGMLAIWKAGGIYVPVDADCPKERVAYILEETGAGLVISDATCLPVLPEGCNSLLLAPDGSFIDPQTAEEELPFPVIYPDAVAYIIYTSGSTGRPKGVMVSHGNLSHFLGHVQEKYGSAGSLSMPFIASPAFDISLFQVFAPWLSGGTVVTLDKDDVRDAGQLLEKLKGVNALDTVPGVYNALIDHIDTNNITTDVAHIRQVFIGGDTIPDELLQRLTGIFSSAAVIVTYGPTEGTIFCTHVVYPADQLPAAAKGTAIGSPVAGTRVYILNADRQLLPPFAEGDIYLGGAGVSQGYFRQEELTAEKFFADPFVPASSVAGPFGSEGGKIYKTGDRGRWLPGGQLQFRGRQDAQVKVRGYRIELGEIEDTIRRHEYIAGAIVTSTGDDSYHRTLIACYVRKKPVQLWPSISEYLGYNDIAYYAMNKDELRAGSYRKAIYAAVKDKVVVDVGTGPEAILAQHCLKAGAKKVYAIEILEEVYQKAKEKIHSLGLQDRIILLLGNVMEIELPEQVDYCVCALVGNMGSSDGCIPIMNSARRFLKATRNMIPFRSLVNIAAISLPEKNIVYPFSETGAYYINNIFSNTGRPFDLRIALKGVTENLLISTPGIFEDLDLTGELPLDSGHSIELQITADGVVDGFLLWLNLHTAPGIVNDIFQSQESFLPVFFPVFSPQVKVNRGDRIEAYVWREFPEGVIYPEYGIRGRLIRQLGEAMDFSYLSERYPDGFRRNEFYERLFPGGEVPVKSTFSPEELRRYIARQLPDYMVPAVLVELESLPLTANGKVDRRRLQELMAGASTSSKYEGPRSLAEGKLTRIWSEVLGMEGIGIHDNFFEKGGHSLLATRVVSLIRRELGIDLSIRDLFSYPTPALLSGWLRGRRITGGYPAIGVSREGIDRIPLSYSQERLWFIDRLEGSVAYHLPMVLRLKGALDKEALALSFARIMERHEVLRAIIREQEGEAWQELLPAENWTMGRGRVRRGQEAEQVAALTAQPFRLSQDYLLRADLLDVEPNEDREEYIMVVTLHHIASDGWSMGIIVRELAEVYETYMGGREALLPELPLQYADYALWQRRTIQGAYLEEKLDYWRRQLTGVTPLELPIDHMRPALPGRRGGVLQHRISGELTEALNAISRANGATLFMSLLAGFKVLLYRYSGQTDICVGSPIAGRQQTEIEGVVGFFTNTLALRSSLEDNPSFRELLGRVRETTLSAYDHQEVPFEKVVDAVVGERDLSRSPLFQVVFVLQNLGEIRPRVSLGGLEVRQEEWSHHTSKFDLVYSVTETAKGLALTVEYDTDIYEEATVVRMIGHYEQLLVSIAAHPEGRIGELELLGEEEAGLVGKEFASGRRYLPVPAGEGWPASSMDALARSSGGLTLADLLVAQAGRTPARLAVTDGEKSYSYKELSARSNQLGNYLRRKGIREDTLVGMYMEKGIAMIAGIVGILKAGGAYVPMDPDYPDDRVRYMLEDTSVKWVLSSGEPAGRLRQLVTQWGLDLEVVVLENDLLASEGGWLSAESAELPVTELRPEHLAYIIYTSGSTGRPKGVMVEHRQVVRLLKPETSLFDFGEEDVWTMFHSYCFDFSVWEIYGALLFGGRLVLISKAAARDTQQFAMLLVLERVTVLNQTPSAYYVLQEELEKKARNLSLRYVIFGGEALNPAKVKRLGSVCRLINMYGITETTVHVSYQELGERELSSGRSIIGHPIPTLQVYILSKEQKLSPVGVPGEIYIGGEGVARGYWNREALTTERFLPDTFSGHMAARLYRSGDLGRWLPDGRIEYLGRIDEQVKIRGHRIELGEIMHAIGLSGLVYENVVLGRTGDNGGTQLAGYVIPGRGYSREKLIACLQKTLPDYMVPTLWMEIGALPLTANGKLDRTALPEPGSDRLAGSTIAPRNGTERKIAAIWEELLSIGPVGIMDNFFQLGGDSIMVIRVVSKIQKAFGHELKIADVYQAPTIEQLAALLDGRETGVAGDTPSHETEAYALADAALIQLRETVLARLPDPGQIADLYPMSDIQQGMVFASLKDPGEAVYHVQEAYALPADLDEEIFEQALSMLVEKHVILRTAFDLGSHEKGLQIVYNTVAVRLDRVDISHLDETAARGCLMAYVEGERRRPFIMDKAPLWRASLFKGEKNYIFLFQSHHAILDGWSVASMNTELGNVYLGLKANGYQGRLELLRCSHREYILSGILQKEQEGYGEFWKKQLSGYSRLAIFLEEETRERSTRNYDPKLWALLKQRTREDGVTPRALFLGACLYALGQLTYEKDMTIGLVTNTRPAMEDGDKILGCFLNTIPLRIEINGSDTWKEYFLRIGNKLLELKGMDRVTLFEISRICEDRSAGNPFFDVLFNFINFHIYDDLQPDREPAPLQETPAGEDPADYLDYSVTNTFLDCDANITGDRLRMNISLRRKLVSGKSAEDLQDYVERVIHHYLYHQEQRLCDTTVISSEEKNRILAFSGKQGEMEWTFSDQPEREDRPAVIKEKDKGVPPGGQLNSKITGLMKKEGSWFGNSSVIPKNLLDIGGFYPATYQQHKEYTRYRIIGEYAYNSIIDIVFSPVDEELVMTAIDRTMQRHESLRTTFRRVEGKTVQYIHDHFLRESLVEFIDLTVNEDREQQAAMIYRKAELNPFDFEKGPLVSFKLIRYTEDILLLFVVLHHVISDAYSLENLRREIKLQFDACQAGQEDPLPPLDVQVKEYACWVSTFMDSGKGAAAQRYYSEMILRSVAINGEDREAHSYRKVLDKELKRALKREDLRDMEDAYGAIVNIFPSSGASYKTFIKQDLFRALKQLSAFCGSSLFMAMTAAIMLTFRRVSGKKGIRVSIPFSTRVFEEFEKLIGWLSSEIIIGVEVDESLDFRQFTQVVADVVLKTADHRFYPHEKLMADLDLPLNILAPVLVNYIQNAGKKIGNESPAHEEKGSGHFNFKCTMMEYSDGVSLLTDYNQNAYQPADIENFYATLFTLLEKIASHPSLPLNEITCD